jgi:hypothetical protein
MHKRWSFFLSAALIALPSFAAESLWITPVAPSTTDTFSLRVFAPGCVMGLPVVTSSDLPPHIDVLLKTEVCPSLPGYPPFEGPTLSYQSFSPRPAGDYRVTVRLQSDAGEIILAERRLVIHDAVPDVEVRPWVVPVAGGMELNVRAHGVLCLGSNCPATGIVTIDGQPFTARYEPDHLIVDAAPPHAEGAVDVGIRYNGQELRSNALLYYYDPSHEPEPSVFEPVLLPVLDSGSGVFGTSWVTEAVMSKDPSYWVGGSAPTNGHETDGFRRLPGRGFPRGAIFHVPRRESEQTHFALRLRELSRNPDAYGTELPVVREKDFAGPRMSLYDVPVGPGVRSKLRLYSLNPPKGEKGEVSVTFLRAGTNRYVLSWGLSWTRPPCTYESCMPAYADLDLDTLSWNPEMRAGGRFDLSFWTNYADAWAFITVVDNTTQAVSVISPR